MLKTIRPAQDEKKGWSDYRIGCSKELDLDILPHQVSLQSYSATLGHKVGQLEMEQFLCPNDGPASLLSRVDTPPCRPATPSPTTLTSSPCGSRGLAR